MMTSVTGQAADVIVKAAGASNLIPLDGGGGSSPVQIEGVAVEPGREPRTYYAGVTGTPTALGPSAAGKVFVVAYANSNMPGEIGKLGNEFKAKFNDDYYTLATYNAFAMLSRAVTSRRMSSIRSSSFFSNDATSSRNRRSLMPQGSLSANWNRSANHF